MATILTFLVSRKRYLTETKGIEEQNNSLREEIQKNLLNSYKEELGSYQTRMSGYLTEIESYRNEILECKKFYEDALRQSKEHIISLQKLVNSLKQELSKRGCYVGNCKKRVKTPKNKDVKEIIT